MRMPPLRIPGDGGAFDVAIECSPNTADIAIIGVMKGQLSVIRNSIVAHIAAPPDFTAGLAIDSHFVVHVGEEYLTIWDHQPGVSATRIAHQCDVGDDVSGRMRWIARHHLQILFRDALQSWDCKSGKLLEQVDVPAEFNLVAVHSPPGKDASIVTLNDSGRELSVWSASSLALRYRLPIDENACLIGATGEVAILYKKSSPMLSAVFLPSGDVLCEFQADSQSGVAAFCSDGQHVVTSLCDRGLHSGLSVTNVFSGIQRHLVPSHPFRPRVIPSRFHRAFATITNDKRHPVDRTSLWGVDGREVLRTAGHTASGAQAFSSTGAFISVSNEFGAEHCVSGDPAGTVVVSDFSTELAYT